ncbi:MAG: hypothetical protein R2860_10040 [Desulfobacterales bacterium]
MESEVPVKSFKGNNKFIPPRYFETTGHGEKTFFVFLCDLCFQVSIASGWFKYLLQIDSQLRNNQINTELLFSHKERACKAGCLQALDISGRRYWI